MMPTSFLLLLQVGLLVGLSLVGGTDAKEPGKVGAAGIGLRSSADTILSVCPWDEQLKNQLAHFLKLDSKTSLTENEDFYLGSLESNGTEEHEISWAMVKGLEVNSSGFGLWNRSGGENGTGIVFHRRRGGATLQLKDGRDVHVRQGDYCVLRMSEEGVRVKTRSLDCGKEGHSCVQKCCPIGHVLEYSGDSLLNAECVDSKNENGTWWIPQFPEDEVSSELFPVSVYDRNFSRVGSCSAFPHAKLHEQHLKHSSRVYENGFLDFVILKDGSVEVSSKEFPTYTLPYGEYCVDGFQSPSDPSLDYSGRHKEHIVLIECPSGDGDAPPDPPPSSCEPQSHVHMVYLVFIPFATVFIILTIIVYTLLWKTHNVHGKTLYGFLLGTLGFYVFSFFSRAGFFSSGEWPCRFVAGGFHFFFLSYICWLSAVNFDVWYTFRYLKAGKASHKSGRVLLYSIFAFGLPAIIVFISVMLDVLLPPHKNPTEVDERFFVPPNYGDHHRYCSISSKQAIGLYWLLPMGILLLTNIGFFSWTIVILREYQRSITAILKGASANNEDNSYGDIKTLTVLRQNSLPLSNGCRQLGIAQLLPRVRFGVFAKIFVLTGVTWIFELVGWFTMDAVEEKCGLLRDGLTWVFALVDTFNILLAVAVFFLFVWKQRIFDQLWHGYPCIQGFLSIFIVGKVFETPKEKKMSITALTMSTLRRDMNGSRSYSIDSRKVSTDSVRSSYCSAVESTGKKIGDGRKRSVDLNRKFSSESRKFSSESRKASTELRKGSTESIRKNSTDYDEREGGPAVIKRKSSSGSSMVSDGYELPVVPEETDEVEFADA